MVGEDLGIVKWFKAKFKCSAKVFVKVDQYHMQWKKNRNRVGQNSVMEPLEMTQFEPQSC